MEDIIKLQNVVLRHPDVQFAEPMNWTLHTGEHWAVIGPNGSGKTVFIDTLTGKYAIRGGIREYPWFEENKKNVSETLKVMAFRDIYSLQETTETLVTNKDGILRNLNLRQ